MSTEAVIDDNSENLTPEGSTLPPAESSVEAIVAELTSSNDGFDPKIHATNPDGSPRRRGDGSYAMRRGRKPGKAASAATEPQDAPSDTGATQVAQAAETAATMSNKEAARQVCNLAVGVMVAAVGPEWAPRDKAEADNLSLAVKNYFDARGQVQLSPEWGLVFAVVAYSAPRFAHENTASKFDRLVNWGKKKYLDLRLRFGKKS